MNAYKFLKKSWVIGAAVALIAGSTTVMAFALNNGIPQSGGTQSEIPASVSAQIENTAITEQPSSATPVYTLVDRSKQAVDTDELLKEIGSKPGMTPEETEQVYKDVLANMTPGDKDMTADQAAALCADIIQTAYGANLTGYTAEASFSRNPLPYSDNWGVIFHPPGEVDDSVRYYASVNSVSGALLNAGFYNLSYRESHDSDLTNPAWVSAAEAAVSVLLPENVQITSSKVVSATEFGGVSVVCDLSDGSAWGVRLTGESKSAVVYIVFPNGYDGSMDYKPVTEGGVG